MNILKNVAADELKNLDVITSEDIKRVFARVRDVRAKRPRLEDYTDFDV